MDRRPHYGKVEIPTWTLDKCWEIAANYKNVTDYMHSHHAAYRAGIVENGNWNDIMFPDTQRKYTKKQCRELASHCKGRWDFGKKHQGAYLASKRNRWINDFFSPAHRNTWTKEQCKKESKDCNLLTDFRKKNRPAYDAGLPSRGNWNKELFPNTTVGIRWTEEKAAKIAKKYKTRGEFEKTEKSCYNYMWKRKLLDKLCPHMPVKVNTLVWTKETSLKEVEKYKGKKRGKQEFYKNSNTAYDIIKNLGLLEKYFPDTTSINYYINNKDECEKLAKTCKNRGAFKQLNSAASKAAKEKNWLNEFFGEVKYRTMTDKFVRQEAKKYKTKIEFYKKDGSAYNHALKHNLIDQLFPKNKTEEKTHAIETETVL